MIIVAIKCDQFEMELDGGYAYISLSDRFYQKLKNRFNLEQDLPNTRQCTKEPACVVLVNSASTSNMVSKGNIKPCWSWKAVGLYF